MPLLSKLLS